MSDTQMRLLRAAAAALGGEDALATHLDISLARLGELMDGLEPLPDKLLLRTVDILLQLPEAPIEPPPAEHAPRDGHG
jgi:hypothetical protein